MSQRELAAQLGVSEATVSKYRKMGMPVESGFEACMAWRQRSVNPYIKPGTSRQAPAAPAASGLPMNDLAAGGDPQHAYLQSLGVMRGADAVAVATALMETATAALAAAKPLGALEPALRAALGAVPPALRSSVEMPELVWRALCGDVLAYIESTQPTAAQRDSERARAAAHTPQQSEFMGRFWYSVAAGEYKLDRAARRGMKRTAGAR